MRRRTRVLSALVVAALGLLAVVWWNDAQLLMAWNLPRRDGPPMLIVAHRGNMHDFPENTAEAIWDAARMDADGIEFDVHQSAEGTWWVIHDDTVDRTTDGTGALRNLSDAELDRLLIDGGPGFSAERHDGIGLARLAEVLDGLADYEGRLYLDLQHSVEVDPADLARHLEGWTASVICRTLEDVRLVSEANPSIETLILLNRAGEDPRVDALLLEAYRQATLSTVADLDQPVVTFANEWYMGRSEDDVLRRAWAAGVHAFLSKRLSEALELRDKLAETQTVEDS